MTPLRLLAAALLLACAALAHAQPFSFVALGDLPYGDPRTSYPPYRALIGAINAASPAFSIHVGDIKSGSTVCSDDEYRAQLAHFAMFAGAVVYTPGDNEWTDCHRPNNGGYDPLERLARLRELFFTPGRSLGQRPLALETQSQGMPQWSRYVENARFVHREVLFATVHIVGSNNGLATRLPAALAEWQERDAANIDWIRAAFDEAERRGARALVFALQADVAFSGRVDFATPHSTGFRASIGETLVPLAAQWGRPVLVINGDSHRFRVDRPFTHDGRALANLVRLVVPGEDDVRAVEVTVDAARAEPFSFRLIAAP
jgi:hypothetical protein